MVTAEGCGIQFIHELIDFLCCRR